jgi:hypothetical protein
MFKQRAPLKTIPTLVQKADSQNVSISEEKTIFK